MTRQLVLLLIIFCSLDNLNADPPSKRQLFNLFKSSILQDSKKSITTISNPWFICNQDSSFYHSDTLNLYNSTSQKRININCCKFLTWTFYKKSSFVQAEMQTCAAPSSDKTSSFNDFFNIKIYSLNGKTYLKIFQKYLLIESFEVIDLKLIKISGDPNEDRLLTLSRLHPD
jgi:hypothetical protein